MLKRSIIEALAAFIIPFNVATIDSSKTPDS